MPGLAGIDAPREIRHEEQIEMGEVVGHILRGVNEIDRKLTIDRHGLVHGLRDGAGGGDRLRDRADAANARRIDQRVERRLARKDALKSPVERRDDLRLAHGAIADVQLDFEIALDTVEWPDDQPAHSFFFCLSTGGAVR
jgi:hypothetical protein